MTRATGARRPTAPPTAAPAGPAPGSAGAGPQRPAHNALWTALSFHRGAVAGSVQRTCAACAAGGTPCAECAHAEDDEKPTIQAKLRVGPSGDRFEMEADRVADHVMRMPLPRGPGQVAPTPFVSRAITPLTCRASPDTAEEDEETVQAQLLSPGATSWVQRVPGEEDDDERDGTDLQAKAEVDPTPVASPAVQSYVESLPGRGQPLSPTARDYFEPRFGYGFDHVRIHTDAEAQRSAGALRARAYTVGPNVVFGPGEYHPHSPQGQRLIAHELTHVVQQGAAHPAVRRFPAPPGGALPSIAESDAQGPVRTVRRAGLDVGDSYVITTPEGGNLLLRVQPDPGRELKGEDQCGGSAAACPNSVGNVASGTTATIKEVRSYGWYVVEAETITGGKRIGFVQEKYLKKAPVAAPETPAQAPPEAEDELTPEEEPDAASFELGDAALEAQEEGEQIEQLGVVQTDDGTNLWPQMDRKAAKLGLLPQNTQLFVERKLDGGWYSVYVERHQRGEALPVAAGTHGFVDASRVNTDMPDPDAWLFRITKEGQGALALAAEVYPGYQADCKLGVAACRDHRFLVNVLVAVNEAKGRKFLYKEKPADGWDTAKTKVATKDAKGGYSGGQIWVPGMDLVKALEGQVSSGSISLEVLNTLADIAIGVAAFIVGLLHGALSSVADVFIGLVDLIKMVGELVVKIFRGSLIADAKSFWEDINKLKLSDVMDMLGAKWNHPNTWDRWKFRGYVIGYAIVEILMLVFSDGIITAIKWAGKASKLGKFAKYLAELPAIKRVLEGAKALKGKTVDAIRTTMKAAEALSEGHGWAAKALRLPMTILRRLSELDIGKLKQLPQWARERFARMADSVKLRLLGCHSPCKVDPDAIVAAMKLAGKGGKKLESVDDVLGVLKTLDGKLKTAKISTKLRKPNSALMKVIKEAGLTDVDFASLKLFLTAGDLENPALAYRTFTRYLTSVVPAKVGPDIKKLNAIAAAMVKAEVRRGSALKGAMFEQWVAIHVPTLASKTFGRITFDLRKLIKKVFPPYRRHVDKWVPDAGEIWDMKHQLSRVPTGQVDDYAALIGKVAPDGNTVKSVNYLFPTKAAAELNQHLASRYKFIVYYIDEATNVLTRLP